MKKSAVSGLGNAALASYVPAVLLDSSETHKRFRFKHPKKASSAIVATESGSLIDVRLAHPKKALSRMDARCSGNLTDSRPLQA